MIKEDPIEIDLNPFIMTKGNIMPPRVPKPGEEQKTSYTPKKTKKTKKNKKSGYPK